MKYNIQLFIAVVCLFSITACTDLSEEVYDKLPVTEFGQTEGEINALIAPIYRDLKDVWPSNYHLMSECSGDMAITPTRKGGDWWDGGQFKEMRLHTWTPNTSLVKDSYDRSMEGITLCNKIYSMIVENDAITDKEQILSEIRAVRAYWYYMLIDFYGNVPLVTDFTDTSLPKTATRAEVYEFLISELNDIKESVREDVSSSSYGKATKGMVYTLLAKIYLNAEVWNPAGGSKWQECIDACDEVMKLDYILEPEWKANFVTQNESSQEIIFPIVFSTSDEGNHIHKRTLHYLDPVALGLNIGTWNGVSAMPDYVKAFDADDSRIEGSFLIGEMRDPATGDVLITAHNRPLIHTIDITLAYNVEDSWGQVDQEEGARCYKWEFEKGINGDLENDFAIFRLADVYLMKAECLVRLGQDNATATLLVNNIRSRAFTDDSKLYDAVTLEDVYNERRFEFAWEIMTRQDQIRFGTFLDPIEGWKPQTDETKLLFPIPQTALDANSNLTQNSGY